MRISRYFWLHIHLVSPALTCGSYQGPRKRESILISRQSTDLLPFRALTGCGTTSFFSPQPFEDVDIEGFLLEVCWSFVFRREDELNEAKVNQVGRTIHLQDDKVDGFKSFDHVCSILSSTIGKPEARNSSGNRRLVVILNLRALSRWGNTDRQIIRCMHSSWREPYPGGLPGKYFMFMQKWLQDAEL